MKIAIDSNDLPGATRHDRWRAMLCDTYMGIDCALPDGFRSVIEGHAVGGYSLTRVTSSHHTADRSRTLIRRDGLELIIFGIPLSGRAVTVQNGREAVLERGAVVVSDTSRPFFTYVDEAADIVWLSLPKKPIAERVRGIEDLVALSFRPSEPVDKIALDLIVGFDEAWAQDLPAHDVERLTTHVLDLMAMTLTSAGLPPTQLRRAALQ